MGAVQREIIHYLVDLGGELSPWSDAVHRALDVEEDEEEDCGVVWTWYPDGWWEWIGNSCWLPNT